mmetsp:Transcript_63740/g.156861  ORF Transcript_63740/g.156861 Transcript_63740/m.156861 type:complete len:90 (-) Transcript_63740:39-308(-)
MRSSLFTMLGVCPGPDSGDLRSSSVMQCSVGGFSPPPQHFVKPAPGADHGVSPGEYVEWFTPNAALLPEHCSYGTAAWFPESGCGTEPH